MGKIVFIAHSPGKVSFESNTKDEFTQYVFDSAKKNEIKIIDLNEVFHKSGVSSDELFYDGYHYSVGGHKIVGEFYGQQLKYIVKELL